MLTLVCLSLLSTSFGWEVSYKNHQVARCQLADSQQAVWLRELQESTDLDIWSSNGETADVLIRPNDIPSETVLSTLTCKTIIEDVEDYFQASMIPGPDLLGDFYDQYPTLDQSIAYMQTLANTYPTLTRYFPNLTSNSIQGRSIPYMIIGGNISATNRWNVFIQSGLHAREWLAQTTGMYLIEALLANYSRNSQVTTIMNRINFHIVPLANPDGILYTQTTDRNWRKNRRANSGGTYGVDLNRNWNCHWGGTGSSGTPSSDTYRGTAVASEPETQAVLNYVRTLGNKLGGVDYHAYGPLVLRSWGWTMTASSDEAWLKPMGDNWAAAIRAVNGVNYVSEKAAELYVASGCFDDWMSNVTAGIGANFPGHGWTIEVRGNSFVMPPSNIRPCGAENFAGFVNWTTALLNRFGNPLDFYDEDGFTHRRPHHQGRMEEHHGAHAETRAHHPRPFHFHGNV
jgi:hypothetical protein